MVVSKILSNILKNFLIIALILLSISLQGCSELKKIWGEAPPPRKVVELKGAPLPSFEKIFGSDDKEAIDTLNAWENSILSSFKVIEGKNKSFLTLDEIEVLVRKGFVKMDLNPEVSVKRARSALTLIGFKHGISSDRIEALFKWVGTNRLNLRKFYQMFIESSTAKGGDAVWKSSDFLSVIQLFGSFAELAGDEGITLEEMTALLQPWIPENFAHAKVALPAGLDLIGTFFGSLCGDRIDPRTWNGQKVGFCIRDLTKHFKPSTPVFDFIFGKLNPLTSRAELLKANHEFKETVESWMAGHHHPAFDTTRVSELATALSIPSPYAFFKLTEWIPKLNAESTPKAFSPSFFTDLAQVAENWINAFTQATENETCTNQDWRNCVFEGKYKPADQLFNEEYATLIRSKNLNYVFKISLYDSIAGYLLEKIDVESGQARITDLITVTIRLLDSNAFAFNVVNRILENPIDTSNAENSLKNIQREGLAQLAALAANLIPERGKYRDNTFLSRLKPTFYDKTSEAPFTLDRLGITTFVYLYDLLTSLRGEYLNTYDLKIATEGPLQFIKRRKIVEAMPRMLYDHFPRVYNECLKWGFERTCGVIFTEMLPSPTAGRDDLETYEMDVLNLTSILLESMMNRCDYNNNDKLSNHLFSSKDEKSCIINVSHALVTRLMNANILDEDRSTKRMVGLVKKFPLARWAGKKMLASGSAKHNGLWIIPPFSIFSGSASMGSIMSLAGELMDSDKVDAINAGLRGPSEDAGDELIYLDQLTEHYLPSREPALRHWQIQKKLSKIEE